MSAGTRSWSLPVGPQDVAELATDDGLWTDYTVNAVLCAVLTDTGWADACCDEPHEFVCEYCGPVPNPTVYELVQDAGITTFDGAESHCVALGGHLASVHSEADNLRLTTVTNDDLFSNDEGSDSFWIGFTDAHHDSGKPAQMGGTDQRVAAAVYIPVEWSGTEWSGVEWIPNVR